jgi:hypothetical protein
LISILVKKKTNQKTVFRIKLNIKKIIKIIAYVKIYCSICKKITVVYFRKRIAFLYLVTIIVFINELVKSLIMIQELFRAFNALLHILLKF